MSYMLDIICQCGEILCEAGPGEMLVMPECEACEKGQEWPSTKDLLMVYGAPYNWPVVPLERAA
jgi:hypothetical protein